MTENDAQSGRATAREHAEFALASVAMLVFGPLHFAGELVDPSGRVHWHSIVLGTLGSLVWAALIAEVFL